MRTQRQPEKSEIDMRTSKENSETLRFESQATQVTQAPRDGSSHVQTPQFEAK